MIGYEEPRSMLETLTSWRNPKRKGVYLSHGIVTETLWSTPLSSLQIIFVLINRLQIRRHNRKDGRLGPRTLQTRSCRIRTVLYEFIFLVRFLPFFSCLFFFILFSLIFMCKQFNLLVKKMFYFKLEHCSCGHTFQRSVISRMLRKSSRISA